MSALPSASKLGLAFTCLGSAVLPRVDSLNEHADKGNAKHLFLSMCLQLGREEALLQVPEKYRAECAALDTSDLPASQAGQWMAELAFAFDVHSGIARVLGENIGRNYAAAGRVETEMAGSADLVGLTPETVVVIDYKTGRQPVTRCRDNWQMRGLAVFAARALGRSRAQAAVLYVDDEGTPRYDWAEWDAFDLDGFASELQGLGEDAFYASAVLATGKPVPGGLRTGSHCKYCPALTTCPAQGAFVRQLVATPTETLAELEAGLKDDETARAVFERVEAVEAVIKKAKAALYDRACSRPIPLGNGEVFGLREVQGNEELDGEIAWKVISERFGAEVADKAARVFDASKAGIKRALDPVAKATDKKTSALMEETLKAIRAAKGATSKRTTKIDVHRAALPEST